MVVYSSDVVILTVSGVKRSVNDDPDIAVDGKDVVCVVVSVKTASVFTLVDVVGYSEIAVVESVIIVADLDSVVINEDGEVFTAFDSDEINSEVTVDCIPVSDMLVVGNVFSKSVEDSSAILVVGDSAKVVVEEYIVDVVIGCISSEVWEDCSDSGVTAGDSFGVVIVWDFVDVDSVDAGKSELSVDVISGDSVDIDISSTKVEGDIIEIVDSDSD